MVMTVELNIKNTKIKIQFSFLLIIAVAIVLDSQNVLYVLLFSFLHELGHLAMLYALGASAQEITFSYYGIGLKHNAKLSYFKEFLFLISGIAVNLLFVALDIHRDINLALFVLNALPIYPLDMGRCVKIVLNNALSLDVSDRVFNAFSLALIIVFGIISICLKSINLILIFIYIFAYWLNRSYL